MDELIGIQPDAQGDSEGSGESQSDPNFLEQKANQFLMRNAGSAQSNESAQDSDPTLSATDTQGNEEAIVISGDDKRKFVFKNIKVDGKEQDLEIDAEKLLPYASQAGTFDRRMSEYDLKNRELEANKEFLLAEGERELLPYVKQLNEFRAKDPGGYARFISEFHERNSEDTGSKNQGISFDELDKVVKENPQVPVVGMLVETLKAFDEREKELRKEIGSLKQNSENLSKTQQDRDVKEQNAILNAEATRVADELVALGVSKDVIKEKSGLVVQYYFNQKDNKFSLRDVANLVFESDIQKAATQKADTTKETKPEENNSEESEAPKFLKGGNGGGAPGPEIDKSDKQYLQKKTTKFFNPSHQF